MLYLRNVSFPMSTKTGLIQYTLGMSAFQCKLKQVCFNMLCLRDVSFPMSTKTGLIQYTLGMSAFQCQLKQV